jgi:hypothetical protein
MEGLRKLHLPGLKRGRHHYCPMSAGGTSDLEGAQVQNALGLKRREAASGYSTSGYKLETRKKCHAVLQPTNWSLEIRLIARPGFSTMTRQRWRSRPRPCSTYIPAYHIPSIPSLMAGCQMAEELNVCSQPVPSHATVSPLWAMRPRTRQSKRPFHRVPVMDVGPVG